MRTGRGAAGEVAAVAVLLGAAGVLFSRNLSTAPNYDEGVYLASMDALRHGQSLGDDVFASQPPGFYLLLQLVGAFAGHSVEAARTGFLLVALLGILGAYVLGRALAGPLAGLGSAGLIAVLPPFASEASRVDADLPSTAIALCGLALTVLALRRSAPLWLAGAAGAVLAIAVSVKLLALAVVVPLAALLLLRRAGGARLGALGTGAAAVTISLVAGYADVLGALWRGVVSFHDEARRFPSPVPNGERLADFLDFRTPSAWLAVLGAAAVVVTWRRTGALWAWVGAAVLFLLVQRPLFDHHLVLLCAAVGAAAGVGLGAASGRLRHRGQVAAGAVLAAVLAVAAAQQWHRIGLDRRPDQPVLERAAARLAACTRPGELVASDQPIAAFRARRVLPGQLVDTSLVRLSTSSLPPEQVLRILERDRVDVVLAGRAFLKEPRILSGLEAAYGPPRRDGDLRLYGRNRCG